jgi:hypothetical protein
LPLSYRRALVVIDAAHVGHHPAFADPIGSMSAAAR